MLVTVTLNVILTRLFIGTSVNVKLPWKVGAPTSRVEPDGAIAVGWREAYRNDRGQGGLLSSGSGTTPTAFGADDDLIAIADNAAGRIHLNVHLRETGEWIERTYEGDDAIKAMDVAAQVRGATCEVGSIRWFGSIPQPPSRPGHYRSRSAGTFEMGPRRNRLRPVPASAPRLGRARRDRALPIGARLASRVRGR